MTATKGLAITRRPGEQFYIGDDIKVTLGAFRGNQIRLIIDAPDHISIKRDNIKKDIDKNIIKEANKQATDGNNNNGGEL